MKSLLIDEDILNSLVVLVDNREQPTARAKERYKRMGRPYERCTLSYGDYSYNFILNEKPFFDTSQTVKPLCMIERKMNLDELAACFGRERKRFIAEFERAKENNAAIYLIVENASWENLLNHKYRSKYNPKAMKASLTAWMARYDMRLIFCKEETTGELIAEILYRDLKERLERGEFDCQIKDL